jgi:hypothetical protein
MTNEVAQIIDALKQGAQALTPVAAEYIKQYQTAQYFYAMTCGITAGIAAGFALIATGIALFSECAEASPFVAFGLWVVAGLFGIICISAYGNYIAPLPSIVQSLSR